jgi:hypothetical protein
MNAIARLGGALVDTLDDTDRLAAVEHRLALLEAFLDSGVRECQRLSADEIRATWRTNAARKLRRDAHED